MPMNAYPQKEHYTVDDLLANLANQRAPENGCPWDKVQTHTSIRMNFLEEAYEAVDAIEAGDTVQVDYDTGVITDETNGKVFHAEPFPPFIQNIISAGGLMKAIQK